MSYEVSSDSVVDSKSQYVFSPDYVVDANPQIVECALQDFVTNEVVIVTNVFDKMGKSIQKIIKGFQDEHRTFMVLGKSEGKYIIIREVEEDTEYISSIGRKVLLSDRVDWSGTNRGIIEPCPEGTVVMFFIDGKVSYFNTDFSI